MLAADTLDCANPQVGVFSDSRLSHTRSALIFTENDCSDLLSGACRRIVAVNAASIFPSADKPRLSICSFKTATLKNVETGTVRLSVLKSMSAKLLPDVTCNWPCAIHPATCSWLIRRLSNGRPVNSKALACPSGDAGGGGRSDARSIMICFILLCTKSLALKLTLTPSKVCSVTCISGPPLVAISRVRPAIYKDENPGTMPLMLVMRISWGARKRFAVLRISSVW